MWLCGAVVLWLCQTPLQVCLLISTGALPHCIVPLSLTHKATYVTATGNFVALMLCKIMVFQLCATVACDLRSFHFSRDFRPNLQCTWTTAGDWDLRRPQTTCTCGSCSAFSFAHSTISTTTPLTGHCWNRRMLCQGVRAAPSRSVEVEAQVWLYTSLYSKLNLHFHYA